ncbi:MAG: hypothetical protein M3N46_03595 [Actinomycetota bacterium]|nr:hypothetical protein [Actinomycetota bacterium]
MSTTSSRLPLSVPNIVLIGGCLAGAVTTIVLQNWFGAILLLMLGGGGLLSALVARRAGASDWLRINAIEYRDERDARLASHGFAVVGAWALVLATLELVAATIFVGAVTLTSSGTVADGTISFSTSASSLLGAGLETIAALQLFVLALVWGIANTRAVKRG